LYWRCEMETKKRLTLRYYECEHIGDLSRYEDAVFESGAKVIESDFSPDEEEAWIRIEVEDFAAFRKRFRKTEGWDFCNLADHFGEVEK